MDTQGWLPQNGKTRDPMIGLKTIDAISLELGSVPVIPAITLGEASLAVDPAQKLAVTWGSLKNPRRF